MPTVRAIIRSARAVPRIPPTAAHGPGESSSSRFSSSTLDNFGEADGEFGATRYRLVAGALSRRERATLGRRPLNWALDGRDRLTERGYFLQPASAAEALQRLEDLSSPVSAFVRDRCRVAPSLDVLKDDLWIAWKGWCTDEGRSTLGTKAVFFRDLLAAYPTLKATRSRWDGKRVHVYEGIGIRTPGDDDDLDPAEEEGTPPPLTSLTTPDHPDPVRAVVRGRDRSDARQTHRSETVARGVRGRPHPPGVQRGGRYP